MTTDQVISRARIAVITLSLFLPIMVDQGPVFSCVLLAGASVGGLFFQAATLAFKQARRARRLRNRKVLA